MSEDIYQRRHRGIFQNQSGLPTLDSKTLAEEIACAHSVRTYIEQRMRRPTLLDVRITPALTLYMYNVASSIPKNTTPPETARILAREYTRMHRTLTSAELHATHPDNPLPPIGIEVEIEEGWRRNNRNTRTETILDILGIDYERRTDSRPPMDELEVNPTFSYSASVQNRLLHELAVFGALRVKDGVRPTTRATPPHEMYSLHLNFGIPRSMYLSVYARTYTQVSALSTLSTLIATAFTSEHRLLRRKTSDSIHITEASVHTDPIKNSSARIELRAGEYRDFPTYRMLTEAQLLVAMGCAAEKQLAALPCTPCETELASLWQTFSLEPVVQKYHTFLHAHSLDTRLRGTLSSTITPAMREAFRSLISRYARRIHACINAAT